MHVTPDSPPKTACSVVRRARDMTRAHCVWLPMKLLSSSAQGPPRTSSKTWWCMVAFRHMRRRIHACHVRRRYIQKARPGGVWWHYGAGN